MHIALGIGIGKEGALGASGPTPPVVDPDAQAYFDAIVSAGSTISAPQQAAVNTFCLAAKAGNYWTNLLEINPFCGSSLAGALVKLKGINSTTNTNHGFAGGDYSADAGLQGDGTSYLTTGVLVSDVGSNIGLSFYLKADDLTAAGNGQLIGAAVAFANDRAIWFFGGFLYSEDINPIIAEAYSYSSGLYHSMRSGNTTLKFYIGGQLVDTNAASSSTAAAAEIGVFAGGDGSIISSRLGCFYAIDDGAMGDSKAALFGEAVRQMVDNMGRNSPSQPIEYVPWVGQSLALGFLGTPSISTTADTNNNRMATTGTIGRQGSSDSSIVQGNFPLLREYVVGQETALPGFVSGLSNIVTSSFALGGAFYSQIKKGTTNYNLSLTSIGLAFAQYPSIATSFALRSIMVVHGESDQLSTTYAADLEQWRADYEADINTLLGTSITLKMFHSQIASWSAEFPPGTPGHTTHTSSLQMIVAVKANPTKHRIVCPKYFLAYNADGTHLTAASYLLLGQYYCKAFLQDVVNATPWVSFYPTNVARTLAVITITFPRTGLVFDTVAVADHADTFKGFEYTDDSGSPPAIIAVAIVGGSTNQVQITLAGVPTGNKRVRYAYTATNTLNPNSGGNATVGPRGNLRNGDALPDWCLVFDEVCP